MTMPKTLEIPDDLATALTTEAEDKGLTLPDYAVRILSSASRQAAFVQTGAELVEYWKAQGVIGCRQDIADSQAYARSLRNQVESRTGFP